MGSEVAGDFLGDEYKGYVFRITGGNDKQGFTMKQGIMTNLRVRLLLSEGQKNYRARRTGERKKKSVRGCICGPDLSVIALTIVKKGESEIAGLTDDARPRKRGPKRVGKIRKMFNLDKETDDVRHYVIKEKKTIKGAEVEVGPKIQRLVTDRRIRRKRARDNLKKAQFTKVKNQRIEYEKVLSSYLKDKKAKHTAAPVAQ